MSNRFLIGRGEFLAGEIPPPKRVPKKAHPYTLTEALDSLRPQVRSMVSQIEALPARACPRDIAVSKLTLHPAYIAKSFFPSDLLRQNGLESIGSRTIRVEPRKVTTKNKFAVDTTQLYIAGTRASFRAFEDRLATVSGTARDSQDLIKVEEISALTRQDRVRTLTDTEDEVFEVGLHVTALDPEVLGDFQDYVKAFQFEVNPRYQFQYGGLLFVAVQGSAKQLPAIADFSLMRTLRAMPRLRGVPRPGRSGPTISFALPEGNALSREPRVAILDGGLPDEHVLEPYVRNYIRSDENASDYVTADLDGVEHGFGVTSAVLFGPIQPGQTAPAPFAPVDHYRVLDSESKGDDPYEFFRMLGHIEEVLLSRQYQFINISVGPWSGVVDQDVDPWTMVIDSNLADGETIVAVAVGNNGDLDRQSRNDRILVPGDSVNALAVGACSTLGRQWTRASYSARGPGRMPGKIKPDLLTFGGEAPEYFHVVRPGSKADLMPVWGTSFAAPLALRFAVGIRAVLGDQLHPLSIKALLIHSCEPHASLSADDVGWGRLHGQIEDFTTCPDGCARIVYQGTLRPGKYLRAPIPLPNRSLAGPTTIKATFCYATQVDPQDASSYTKAGLEVSFRPDNTKKKRATQQDANSQSFFSRKAFRDENAQRADLGKWETVLHAQRRFRPTSLTNPTFDIHYNAREAGHNTTSGELIRYALIVSVIAPKDLRLYDDILAAHRVLAELQPVIEVPVVAVQTRTR